MSLEGSTQQNESALSVETSEKISLLQKKLLRLQRKLIRIARISIPSMDPITIARPYHQASIHLLETLQLLEPTLVVFLDDIDISSMDVSIFPHRFTKKQIRAFYNSVMERVPHSRLTTSIKQRIDEWLSTERYVVWVNSVLNTDEKQAIIQSMYVLFQ